MKHLGDVYEGPQTLNNKRATIIAEALSLPTVSSKKTQSMYTMKEILPSQTVNAMLKSIQKKMKERKNDKLDQDHFAVFTVQRAY